jgi:hypothetical protein
LSLSYHTGLLKPIGNGGRFTPQFLVSTIG